MAVAVRSGDMGDTPLYRNQTLLFRRDVVAQKAAPEPGVTHVSGTLFEPSTKTVPLIFWILVTLRAMVLAALVLSVAQISPADPRICYVGRFEAIGEARTCQWPASEVRLKVKGASLQATIEEKGKDGWAVVVDGVVRPTLTPKEGTDTYTISLGNDAVHDVRLVKRTEAFVGTTTFHRFAVPGGTLLKAEPKKRHLEFVGDSITCGFGNEGKTQNDPFLPETENAYMSYASIAGRAVDADVTLIAWSGRKMWPDNTMPSIYDRILPDHASTTKWGFRNPAPDAVVIHLATNDFGRTNPDEKGWTGAYEAFLKRIRRQYPDAHLYAAMGSMMHDGWPVGNKALSTLRGYLQRMVARVGDPKLHLIEFDVQKEEDGIGSSWHPNLKTHEKMADRLSAALRTDLGW